MTIRDARTEDIEALAQLWYDGWQDAHAAILPPELAELCTLTSFRERLQRSLSETRVAGPPGEPHGFAIVNGDELDQLYLAASARGAGIAAALVTDALGKLRERGVATAWLACAIGNDRAARFYEKNGWRRVGTMTIHLQIRAGVFPLDVWRYEIAL
ncbi:MAG: GNAT family N-acetyltransferase [Rhodomicrobiaceae bacterium]